ncbi:MAG: thiamine pyrophosphate-binding protein [Chloroflexi bacterium]|nr:thiamine pyrophosphate-binding protein [Chloroflexota bacterium]
MSLITVAKRIADLLANEGVECFYSLPEVTFGLIHKGVVDNGIKMVAPHHETVCGYMAEAHASLTGQFQVAAGAQGPGTVNLLPCIAHSYYERIPVLYIGSSRRPIVHQSPRQPKFQCPNIVDAVKPFTKWSTMLGDPLLVDEVFTESFRQLRTGMTGPVYVEVSNTILGIELEFPPLPNRATYACAPICPPEAMIRQIAGKLAQAKLPMIISGAGVRVSRAKEKVSELLAVLKSPVMCTFRGRATVPDNHPQLLDVYLPEGDEAWAAADVVLVLGSSMGEKEGFGGRNLQLDQPNMPWGPQSGQYWIHVDKDPYLLGRNRPVNLPVLGDLNEVLPRLTAELKKRGPFREPGQLEGWRRRRAEDFKKKCESFKEGKAIHPARLMMELDKCLPEDAIWVKGGGAISLWQMEYLRHNFSEMLWSLEMGMLGTELGYANACELAKKKGDHRRVVCITGDGSFGFYPMEIETAVRHNLPVLFIVGYDQQWGMEVQYYDMMFGGREGYETSHAVHDEVGCRHAGLFPRADGRLSGRC